MGKDAVAAAPNNDAVAVAYHVAKQLAEPLLHLVGGFKLVADCHEDVVDRMFVDKALHGVAHATAHCHVDEHLARVEHQSELF